jgi:hypothetical protein
MKAWAMKLDMTNVANFLDETLQQEKMPTSSCRGPPR